MKHKLDLERASLDPSVTLEDVNIEFPIYSSHGRSLKRSALLLTTGGRFGLSSQDRVVVQSLKGISFSAKRGDRIGLIGRNGAGKTTLLRAIAGVYEPRSGQVRVSGRVASVIDVHVGMDLEATGYENIRLRSLLLSIPRDGRESYVASVVEFCELREFLDLPVRTYSSGMVLRLAFAMATTIVPEILLMDEWIGVGDQSFAARAQQRLKTLVGDAGIFFLASHNRNIIMETCNRLFWLEGGELRLEGKPDDVYREYDAYGP